MCSDEHVYIPYSVVTTTTWRALATPLILRKVFGLFTLIMFCDQMCGVVNNVDKIGGWQKGEGSGNDADVEASSSSSSSKMENIRRVFGDDVSALSWILPVPAGSVGALRKRGARHNQGIMSV